MRLGGPRVWLGGLDGHVPAFGKDSSQSHHTFGVKESAWDWLDWLISWANQGQVSRCDRSLETYGHTKKARLANRGKGLPRCDNGAIYCPLPTSSPPNLLRYLSYLLTGRNLSIPLLTSDDADVRINWAMGGLLYLPSYPRTHEGQANVSGEM